MNPQEPLPHSPELMSVGDTGLLVIDVQERLIRAIADWQRVVFNCGRLIDGARLLSIPTAATEQYPKGLGPTVDELAERLTDDRPSKLSFSCGDCPEIFSLWRDRGLSKILICGIEAHVCVAQTVFDLLADGWRVYVAVDAVGSRFEVDRETALRRIEASGATPTTTEAALFEWCQRAGTESFREISRLVRQTRLEDVGDFSP